MWNLQLSNWLVSFAGAAATLIAAVVFAAFLIVLVGQANRLRKRKIAGEAVTYGMFAGTIVAFIFAMALMFSFQSNAPKYTLDVEASPSPQANSAPLPELQDLSPSKLTAEQSSQRLKALREQQKEASSVEKKKD